MSREEAKVIAKMLDLAEMTRLWEMGLRYEVFEDPICRNAFIFASDYWLQSQMRHTPTRDVMAHEYPNLSLDDEVEETTDWLVGVLKKRYAVNRLQDVMRRALDRSNADDPIGTLDRLWHEAYDASQVNAPRNTRVDITENVDARRERYIRDIENRTMSGVPIGLTELDDHTRGILPGELAAVAAYTKCVDANTWIFTDCGLQRISEIVPALPVGEDTRCDVRVATRSGSARTELLYHQGPKTGVRVVSSFATLTMTGVHRVLVPTPTGLEWRYASQIVVGDQVLVDSSTDSTAGFVGTATLSDGTPLTPELCRLMGWIVAEGHIRRRGISIAKKEADTEYSRTCRDDIIACSRSLGDDPRVHGTGIDLHARLSSWLIDVAGVAEGLSADKRVPSSVLSAPTRLVREFLRGYFEGDADYSRGISVTTASADLAEQVRQLLLHHAGVVSRVRPLTRSLESGEQRRYWKLSIPEGNNGRRFADFVAPLSQWNTDRLAVHCKLDRQRVNRCSYLGRVNHSRGWAQAVIRRVSSSGNYRSVFPAVLIPLARNLMSSRTADMAVEQIVSLVTALTPFQDQLSDMTEWEALRECAWKGYVGSEVESVEECAGDFWDFCVRDVTSSYVAGGIMGHNTGKSWLLCKAFDTALRMGIKPIFFTLEMNISEIEDRIDAIHSGVSYQALSQRTLGVEHVTALRAGQDDIAQQELGLIERPRRGERTVKHMVSRARQVGAGVIIIDQLSFIDTEKQFSGDSALRMKHGEVVFELKDEISREDAGKIPCILAVQLNRQAAAGGNGGRGELYNFANSSMVEQTVDLALGLWRNQEMRANNAMGLDIMGSRRCDTRSWTLAWHLTERTEIAIREEFIEG